MCFVFMLTLISQQIDQMAGTKPTFTLQLSISPSLFSFTTHKHPIYVDIPSIDQSSTHHLAPGSPTAFQQLLVSFTFAKALRLISAAIKSCLSHFAMTSCGSRNSQQHSFSCTEDFQQPYLPPH